MSVLLKSLFNFSSFSPLDSQINARISKIDSLVKELENDPKKELPPVLKDILDIAFFDEKGQSLFGLVYQTAAKCSMVEWVPLISKVVGLFSANSQFIKIVSKHEADPVSVEKKYLPSFLFKNNLLSQNTAYRGISNSSMGHSVTVIDYVFIRLLHAIEESSFNSIPQGTFDQQFQSDDIYAQFSHNPYLLLLRNYFWDFKIQGKIIDKLINLVKLFFVDELALKHRLNNSFNYMRESSVFSFSHKIKPHFLLVVFLLLRYCKHRFDQRYQYFYELTTKFSTLVDENDTFFRYLFRIFLFSFLASRVEEYVIDQLEDANQRKGVFQIKRYSESDYSKYIQSNFDVNDSTHYKECKIHLLKLLEKDNNLIGRGKIHFGLIRTINCFLKFEQKFNGKSSDMTKSFGRNEGSESMKRGTEAIFLQKAIQKMYLQGKALNRRDLKSQKKLNQSNLKIFGSELESIKKAFQNAYQRNIDTQKLENQKDLKETVHSAELNIRGTNEDYCRSFSQYRNQTEINCWNVPLKESEYLLLYQLFYFIAKKLHSMNPWAKPGSEPTINLRYFCNPVVFTFTLIVIMLISKILF